MNDEYEKSRNEYIYEMILEKEIEAKEVNQGLES